MADTMIDLQGGTYHYDAAGSNTPGTVTTQPTTLYGLTVTQNGGSAGFLQIYNGNAGTPGANITFTVAVPSGTSGAGTPGLFTQHYGPYGIQMNNGLYYLWAAGPTGTVAHGVNAGVTLWLSKKL